MDVFEVEALHVQRKNGKKSVEVVKGISFAVKQGECIGIVGESGSGKSTAMQAIMGLLPESAEIRYKQMEGSQKGRMAMVFQNPSVYLNPSLTIGRQIAETVRLHQKCTRKIAGEETLKLLEMVGIRNTKKCFSSYPFELSGGMQQRVVIAIALACNPKVLIVDEPTTALDVTIQKQILDLLQRIVAETKMAVIMVTHDLSVAAMLCDRVLVMQSGVIVEEGSVPTIFHEPREPYTKELLHYAKSLQQSENSVEQKNVLLQVKEVIKRYQSKNLLWKKAEFEAVEDVSLTLYSGETFGVVGESGSGKTTLARMIAGILSPTSGHIHYERGSKADVQMIFQQSYTSFNPRFSLEQILIESLRYQTNYNRKQAWERVQKMMNLVGLSMDDIHKYPHQFSGGQQQRIGIARALISEPKLVICDEPLSSLDVSIQAQILKLLKDVQKERELTYLFISHDLNVVRHMSQRMGVMYRGGIVESGDTQEIYKEPWHPYTKELLTAVLSLDPSRIRKKRRLPMKEEDANSYDGCPYASRCGYKIACCHTEKPGTYRFGSREVACFLYSKKHNVNRSPDYIMTTQI